MFLDLTVLNKIKIAIRRSDQQYCVIFQLILAGILLPAKFNAIDFLFLTLSFEL